MDMNTLLFEKFSKLDRIEPVSFGIPFAEGELVDPSAFRLMDGNTAVPCQVTVTGAWPDGSVRWLFVRSILSLPGNASKKFSFVLNSDMPNPEPVHRVITNVSEDDGSIHVDTGPLSLSIPARGIFPVCSVQLNDKPVCSQELFDGFRMQYGNEQLDSREVPVTLTIEEDGPLCTVVRIDTTAENQPVPVRVRLYFWANMPWFTMAYTVTDQQQKLETVTEVRDWSLELKPAGKDPVLRTAAGCYRDQVQKSDRSSELRIDAEWIKRDSSEHQSDCYSHNTWADWQSDQGGILVSVRHAVQNFPKAYSLTTDRLGIEFYPCGRTEPLEWFAGTAKTHEALFHFHGPDASDEELGCRAAHFQLGDYPILSPKRFAHSRVWVERIFDSCHSRKVLVRLCRLADSRPVGYGIFNFGDDVGMSYTNQGRGESGQDEGDKLIWLNNEYDATHHYYLFWALTGERRFLEYGLNSARHWMDVDIVHGNSHPALNGGHITHCRRHAGEIKTTPSHQWVQGLFDTHHLIGNPDAAEFATGVADNVIWLTKNYGYLKPGRSTREMGWALRAMLNTWRETGEEKYHNLAERIESLFAEWGRGTGELLAPYTVHSEIRSNFMNAVVAISLAMWSQETGSKQAEQIVTAIADDIIENGMTAFGLPYYKDLPSVRRMTAGIMIIQMLGCAYALTRDPKYINAGLPGLEDWMAGGNSNGLGRIKKAITNGLFLDCKPMSSDSKLFSVSMPAVLGFIAAADNPELTAQLDYSLKVPAQ